MSLQRSNPPLPYGALVSSVLLADPLAREVALQEAKGLASTFNPKAGVLTLGNEAEEASVVGCGKSSIGGARAPRSWSWSNLIIQSA